MKRVLLSWSGGKDSAWALHILRQMAGVEIAGLLSVLNGSVNRVAGHHTRRELVAMQAERARLPLWTAELPSWPTANTVYEQALGPVWTRALAGGITHIAFGDLFLADIRSYREQQLTGTGLAPLFPLWHLPTASLAVDMIAAGIKAKVVCIDPRKLRRTLLGRDYDPAFLKSLPAAVDPCGENGEFHTFVYAAPFFAEPLAVRMGSIHQYEGLLLRDVVSAHSAPARDLPEAGLCAGCRFMTRVVSDRGSFFLRCRLADKDPAFPRYPRLPVVACSGWLPAEPDLDDRI